VAQQGRALCLGTFDGAMMFWLTTSGAAVWVWSVAWSMDNLRIVSSDDDGTMPAWNASCCATAGTSLCGRERDGHTAAFSGDGSRMESGGARLHSRRCCDAVDIHLRLFKRGG
jgi:WD40 repeat protein